jgi:leucyl-tRNA synthetase
LVKTIVGKDPKLASQLQEYRKEINMQSPRDRYEKFKERTGFFTGMYLINPFNKENIPLFISGNINNND